MSFGEQFKTFVIERLEENNSLDNHSVEHIERYNKVCELSKQLMEFLTEEQKKIYQEYDRANSDYWALVEEEAYTKGLADGLELNKIFGTLSGHKNIH